MVITLMFRRCFADLFFVRERTKNSDSGGKGSGNFSINGNNLVKNKGIVKDSDSSALKKMKDVADFENSKSAKNSQAVIQSLLEQGKDGMAIDLAHELDTRCGNIEIDWTPPFQESAWVYKDILTYCQGYNHNEYEQLSDLRILNPTVRPNFHSLTYGSEETDIDLLSTQFLQMLAQIETKSSLTSASMALHFFEQEMKVPLRFGQDYINPSDLHEVQNLALDIYGCHRFGGCGPSDYLTLTACLYTPHCQADWSLIDIYQSILSPYNFDQMMVMVNHMLSYQRGG